LKRISHDHYAMMLAYVASLRSEDPHRKVGAVALDEHRRVRGIAYNGLKPGAIVKKGFWDDRELRRRFCIHAEANLCALVKRGDVHTVAVTTQPCSACATLLVALGVTRVIYGERYNYDDSAEILKFHQIKTAHVPLDEIKIEMVNEFFPSTCTIHKEPSKKPSSSISRRILRAKSICLTSALGRG
jgi:dCMP deaminase